MNRRILSLAFILLALIQALEVYACTEISLTAEDGSTVVARTADFARDLGSNMRIQARDQEFHSMTPAGKDGLEWKNKYGYVYFDALEINTVFDGINEEGLSFNALFFPGKAQYENVSKEESHKALSHMDLGAWILGNFSTVDALKKGIRQVKVWGDLIYDMGFALPFHYSVHDINGKALTIEYVGGQLTAYDNQLGVLTNAPEYTYQFANASSYVKLAPNQLAPSTIKNFSFVSHGMGTSLKAIPGGTSSTDRFVRALAYKTLSNKPKNLASNITFMEHLANLVQIPIGSVKDFDKGTTFNDYTQWSTFKDLKNKILYYRTYGNQTLRAFDLKRLNFDGTVEYPGVKVKSDSNYALDNTVHLIKAVEGQAKQ